MNSRDSVTPPLDQSTSGTPTREAVPSAAVSDAEHADAKTPLLAPERSEEPDQDRAAATIVEIQPTPSPPVISTNILEDSAVKPKLFEKGMLSPTGNQSTFARKTDSPIEFHDDQHTVIETVDEAVIKTPGTAFPGFTSTLAIRRREVSLLGQPATPDADFEIIRELGRGGMGKVYLARQRSLDRSVAIKVIKPSVANNPAVRESFLAEAVITGALEHPNIVPIYELCSNHNGESFYAMKEVRGTPWTKSIGTNSEAENLDILLRVADAIGFAHARGVVHRDLKPDNIMIGEFGEVLVMDWGLALPTPEFRKPSVIRQSGPAGTPQYMAPEMATGDVEQIGPHSDVYLLGGLLFRCLVGKSPHAGSNARQCVEAAIRNEIVPTDRHDDLMAVALRAMATQPVDRYPSAKAFQAAIREYQAHASSLALVIHAEAELQTARESGTYRAFERALIEFEEALRLWDGNVRASAGLSRARFDYSNTAFERNDFDLAAEQLDAALPAHAELLGRIHAAKEETTSRLERIRRLKRVAAGLAAFIFVTVSVAGVLIHRAWRQEQAAFAEALTRFRQSQQAIDRLTGISGDLQYFPRLQQVRKNLLEMVADYYDELAAQPSSNPELRLELAASLVRLGDVHTLLAEHSKALAAYSRSTELTRQLSLSHPLPEPTQLVMSSALIKQASSLISLRRSEDAERILQEVIRELEPHAANNSKLAAKLGDAGYQLALVRHRSGQSAEAIKLLGRSVDLFETVSRVDDVELRRLSRISLATTLNQRATLHEQAADLDAARRDLEQAVITWRQLRDDAEDNPDFVEGLANSAISLGNVDRALGHDALQDYRDAIAAYELLVAARPDVPRYRFNLATAQANIAYTLNRLGRASEAKEIAVAAVRECKQLGDEYPEESEFRDGEATARSVLGEVLRDRAEFDLAAAMFQEAIMHWEAQVAEFGDVDKYRELLAIDLGELAQVRVLTSQPELALALFDRSRQLLDELVKTAPETPRYRDAAAWIRLHLADLHWSRGNGAGANTHYLVAIQLREQLPPLPDYLYNFGWLLTQSLAPQHQQSARATELLRQISATPDRLPEYACLRSLAEWRAGRLADARQTLKQMRPADNAEVGSVEFVNAILSHAEGRDDAEDWLKRGIQKMDQTVPGHPRLKRLRQEAENLLHPKSP